MSSKSLRDLYLFMTLVRVYEAGWSTLVEICYQELNGNVNFGYWRNYRLVKTQGLLCNYVLRCKLLCNLLTALGTIQRTLKGLKSHFASSGCVPPVLSLYDIGGGG